MDVGAPIGNQAGTKVDQGNGKNVNTEHHDQNYIENYEEYYTSMCNSLLDNGFITPSGSYETLDGDKLEDYHKKIAAHGFLSVHLAALNEAREKLSKLVFQTITGIKDSDAGNKSQAPSRVEAEVKMNQEQEQFFSQGVNTLMKEIYTHNKAELDKELAKAEDDNSHWYDCIPFCGEGDEKNKIKDAKAAVDRFNQAMQQSYQSMAKALANNGIGGLNKNFTNRINDILNQLNTGLFKPDGSGNYIDVNKLRSEITELSRQLPGIINAQSFILMAEETAQEAKRMVFEAHTGITGAGSQIKAYEQKFQQDAQHVTFLFNTQASNLIAMANLTNKSRYLQKQLDKIESVGYQFLRYLSDCTKVAAVVLIIIGLCTSWIGGLGLALIAAGIAIVGALSTWGAAKIADSVKDEYKPSDTNETDKQKEIQDIKNKKRVAQAEAAEDRIINNIDSKYQSGLKDGYKEVDFAAISSMYTELAQVQNAIRIMLEAYMTRSKATSLEFTAYTGIRGGTGAFSMMDSIMDSHVGQKNMEFQFAAADQKEIVDAYNTEHAQSIQMQNATTTMGWSIAIAVVTAIIGGCIGGLASSTEGLATEEAAQVTEDSVGTGIGVGFALGNGIGANIADRINNTAFGRGSYGVYYTGSIGRYRTALQARLYANAEDELVGNHKASDKVSKKLDSVEAQADYDALAAGTMDAGDGYITVNTNAANSAVKTLESVANVRAILASVEETKNQLLNMIFTNYTGLPAIEGSTVLTSLNRANLEANVQVMSFLKQHIEEQVQVASRARDAAKSLETANVKLIATVAIAAATLGSGGVAAALCVPMVSLASSIIDIIQDTRYINSGKGEIGQPKDKGPEKAPQGANSLEKADDINQNMNFDSGMLEDIGSGKLGINTGLLTAMENKANGLVMVARIVATARKAVAEAIATENRAYGNEAATSSDASEEIVGNTETMTQQELSNKLQAVQNYIQRNNQIADYQRDRTQKICMAVVETAMASVSGVMASKAEDRMTLVKQSHKAPLSATERKEMENLNSSLKGLGIAYMSGALISELTNMTAGAIFDACHSSYHAKDYKHQNSKDNPQASAKATNGEQVMSKQFALTQEASDADASDAMAGGQANIQKDIAELDIRSNNEIGSSVFGGSKAFLQLLKGLKNNSEDQNAILVQNSNERAQLKKLEEQMMQELGAASINLTKAYKDSVEKFQAAEKDYNAGKITNQQLLLAYADMIVNCEQIEQELSRLQIALTKLGEKNKNMNDSRTERDKDKADPFNNPDSNNEPLPTDAIAQNIQNIRTQLAAVRAAQNKLQQAATKEETDEALAEFKKADAKLQESLSQLPETINKSQLMAEVRQNSVSVQEETEIEVSMRIKAAEATKEVTAGKETKLEDIKDPETLQKVYESMHAKIFVPAREARQASLFLKTLLTKRARGEAISTEDLAKARALYAKLAPCMSAEDYKMAVPMLDSILSSSGPLTQEQSANLTIARDQVNNAEGRAKEEQTSFNRFCGVLRDHMKKISNGTRELKAVGDSSTANTAIAPVAPAPTNAPQAPVIPASSNVPAGRTTSAPSAAVSTQAPAPVIDINDPLIQDIMKDLGLDGNKDKPLNEKDMIEIYRRLQDKSDKCQKSYETLKPALNNMQKSMLPVDTTTLRESIDVLLGMNGLVNEEQKAVLIKVRESLKDGKMPEASDIKVVLGIVTAAEGKVQELKEKQKKIYDSLSAEGKKKIDNKEEGEKPVTVSISQPIHQAADASAPVRAAGGVQPHATDVPDHELAQRAEENDNHVSSGLKVLDGNNGILMDQADRLLDMARRGATVNA